jgi:hypothetical protein
MKKEVHDFPKENTGCQNQTSVMSKWHTVLIDSFCTEEQRKTWLENQIHAMNKQTMIFHRKIYNN